MREDRGAHGHRLDAAGAQPGDELEVAQGLGHLLPVQGHHAGVGVVPGQGPAVHGGGVGGGELVVREAQVGAAALDGERGGQVRAGDHGALDVPARPALAEGAAVPGGLPVTMHAPQQRVQRVALAGALRVAAALGEHRGHLVQRHGRDLAQPPVAGSLGGPDVEVDVAVGGVGVAGDPVGQAGGQHGLHRVHHQVDRLGGTHVVVRGEHLERGHVRAEQVGLVAGELPPVHARGVGALEQRVVHVRHVLDVGDLEAGGAPVAVQQVEGHIGAGVAEVRGVVGGDAADVERGLTGVVARVPDGAGGGVVQAQPVRPGRHGGRDGGGPGLHGTPRLRGGADRVGGRGRGGGIRR